MARLNFLAVVTLIVSPILLKPTTAAAAPDVFQPLCVGDCDSDGRVTVDEIILLINVALDPVNTPLTCPAMEAPLIEPPPPIDQIVEAVRNALSGCPPAS